MGCILDRPDINDVHSDTFSVINVDDQVNPQCGNYGNLLPSLCKENFVKTSYSAESVDFTEFLQ